MAHVWGYGRQSRDDKKQVYTQRVQEAEIEKYARSLVEHNLDLKYGGLFFDKGVSGKVQLFDRPFGAELLKALQRGDHLVIAKVDRMARSFLGGATTLEIIDKFGVNLHLLDARLDTSTPTGKAFLQMLIVFAELERQMIRKRILEASEFKRNAGLPWGPNSPIGWKKVGKKSASKYMVNSESRSVAGIIAAFRDDYAMSWETIALWCQKQNVLANRNWAPSRVQRFYRAYQNGFPLANGSTTPGRPAVREIADE